MADIDATLEQQFLNDSGKRTYVITTNRITSGEELKQRNGLGGFALDRRLMLANYQPNLGRAMLG